MIFTKQNLAVVDVAAADKAIPLLGYVCFTDAGETVALNGKSMVVVQGVAEQLARRVPLEKEGWAGERVLSVEHVREVMRGIEKDTLFKGLLECVELRGDGTALLTNGKRTSEVRGNVLGRKWVQWRGMLRKWQGKGGGGVIVDVKRLLRMAKVMDAICDFVEVVADSEGRALLFVGVCGRTGQGVVGVMMGYDKKEIDMMDNVRRWFDGLDS